MSWAAVAAAGVAAVGGVVAATQSGGGSEGSQSTQVTPASWDSISGPGVTGRATSDLWDSFIDTWSGGGVDQMNLEKNLADIDTARTEKYNALDPTSKSRYDWIQNRKKQIKDWQYAHNDHTGFQGEYDQLVAEENSKFPGLNSNSARYKEIERRQNEIEDYRNITGSGAFDSEYAALEAEKKRDFGSLYQGENGESMPSLQEMMQVNFDAQKDASARSLEDKTVVRNRTLADAGNLTSDYQKNITTPLMNFGLGNSTMGFMPKGQQEVSRNVYETGLANAMTRGSVGETEINDRTAHDSTFTPYAATTDYMDKVWPMLAQMQGWRFGTPSTVETGSLNRNPSLAEKAGLAVNSVDAINSLLSNIFKKPTTTTAQPYSSADIAAGNYTPV